MTRMTGPDCAVIMCNLINTHPHTHYTTLLPVSNTFILYIIVHLGAFFYKSFFTVPRRKGSEPNYNPLCIGRGSRWNLSFLLTTLPRQFQERKRHMFMCNVVFLTKL